MTGYLLKMKGDASFARSGWLAIIFAAGRVEEKWRVHGLESCTSVATDVSCLLSTWMVT